MYQYNYSYNILEDNYNGRTIKGFSTNAKQQMYTCTQCPFEEYKKFVNHYGAYDYGDQWVEKAVEGARTNFTRGNADFSLYERGPRGGNVVVRFLVCFSG